MLVGGGLEVLLEEEVKVVEEVEVVVATPHYDR